MPSKNPEVIKAYRESHREEERVRSRAYYYKNRERILARFKSNTEGIRANERTLYFKLKMRVLEHYSGSPPKRSCCGESMLEFLSLDHINGGGNKHKKEVGNGASYYRWIIKNNFPEMTYRVLCHNCNQAIGYYGKCPHQNLNS